MTTYLRYGALSLLAAATVVACVPSEAQMINSIFQSPSKGGKKAAGEPAAPKAPTVITSDEMDIDMKNDVITLVDNVEIDEEGTHIKADKMVIHLKEAKQADSEETSKEIKLIVATGNVVILKKPLTDEERVKGERKATAGKAEYDVDSGTIVLTEEPVLNQGGSSMRGKKITVWRDSDRMKVEGGDSKMVIMPEDSVGTDTDRKSATPAPAAAAPTVPTPILTPPTDSKPK